MSISFGVQDVRTFEAIASGSVAPVYLSSRGNYYGNYQEALDDEREENGPRVVPQLFAYQQPMLAYPPQPQVLAYPPQAPALEWRPYVDERFEHVANAVLSLTEAQRRETAAVNIANRTLRGASQPDVVRSADSDTDSMTVVRNLAQPLRLRAAGASASVSTAGPQPLPIASPNARARLRPTVQPPAPSSTRSDAPVQPPVRSTVQDVPEGSVVDVPEGSEEGYGSST